MEVIIRMTFCSFKKNYNSFQDVFVTGRVNPFHRPLDDPNWGPKGGATGELFIRLNLC